LKIRHLKLLDNLVGACAAACLPAAPARPVSTLQRLLFIRPGGIGDAVLLAPAIISLKKTYPDCQITILAEQRNAAIYTLVPGVAKVFCYDRLYEFIQALRGRYDVVIDTEQWHRLSAVAARLIRAPVKIGFDTNERRRMFTHGIRYDLGAYESDNFFALLKPLGVDSQRGIGAVSIELPLQSISRANELLQPLSSDSFVVIFPGASIEEKRWGAERFRLVVKLLTEAGYQVVVVGGQEDCTDGDVITSEAGMNLAGKTTLEETAAVIARSSLVISGDSGVLHIAAALGISTASLFGPSSESKWAPQGERHAVLSQHMPCSPCSKFGTMPPCSIDARCISDITPDEVIEAIRRLLPQKPEKL
jgi:lipopolysaccharide heptosyltransferase II